MSARIVVAMSGGVDSSVAAALLVQQGYDVTGITLRLWNEVGNEDVNRCCTPEAIRTAQRVCGLLDIPFYVLDAKDEFYNTVVQGFQNGYAKGITPNPCLICNRLIRWGFLLDKALNFGAQYLATGHYARIQSGIQNQFQLHKSVDESKDQSYVLCMLTQAQLTRTILPLGSLTKEKVRELAQRFDLPLGQRKESQDLCFIGGGDYREFLIRNFPQVCNPGSIVQVNGKVIGEHQGLAFYTIGQRRGLGVSSTEALYVVEKDVINNVLIVGYKEQAGKLELIARDTNWISGYPPDKSFPAQVKIRYRAQVVHGKITPIDIAGMHIHFSKPVNGITPGQAVVIYQDDRCLGGGIIEE